MNLQTKINQKILLLLIIILIILPAAVFTIPRQINAQTVKPCVNLHTNPFAVAVTDPIVESAACNTSGIQDLSWWQQLIVLAERIAAHKLLQTITSRTVNWINSGFSGSPLFVQNQSSFFGDIGKYEIKNLVDQVGYDTIGQPFGKNFALNLINQYKNASQNDMQYSLSKVMNDPVELNNYRTNFNYGGWNAFLTNTQFPQNNPIGYDMLATQKLAAQLQGTSQNAAQKVQTALQQGSGFLSPKACPKEINPDYNNGTNEFQKPSFNWDSSGQEYDKLVPACIPWPSKTVYGPNNSSTVYTEPGCMNQAAIDAGQKNYDFEYSGQQDKWASTNECVDENGKSALVATTPGSVVASQITTAMSSTFRQSELGQAVGGSLAAILDALMNKLIGSGLNSLGGLINSPHSQTDNWNYGGQTLNNSTTDGNSNNLIVPESAIVQKGSTTTGVTISGGQAPYSIQKQPDKIIASAQIGADGSTFKVTGLAVGQTYVTVQDSSSPVKTATIQITVNKTGTLLIDFNNPLSLRAITAGISGTNIDLSGGTQPYLISSQPNSSTAMAIIEGDSLVIVGVNPGTTSITLQDSSTPSKTVTVKITVGSETALSTSPTNISVKTNDAGEATILGGTAPYSIQTQPNSTIATADVSSNNLTVAGISIGTTSVTIQDSFSPAETITIPIIVTAFTTTSATPNPGI